MWPPVLNISDGVYVGEGFRSEYLVVAWSKAELAASLGGEWHELMTWILYKNLHTIARESFANQTYTFTTATLKERVAQVSADLLENLREPAYEEMLAAYQRSNS